MGWLLVALIKLILDPPPRYPCRGLTGADRTMHKGPYIGRGQGGGMPQF